MIGGVALEWTLFWLALFVLLALDAAGSEW